MAISYPLSLPDAKIARTMITARNSIGLTINKYTAQQQVYDWGSGLWILGVTCPPLEREDAEPWQSFLLALRGPYGTFHAGDDTAGPPRGTATGTPLVNGASQTGFTLVTDGWTPSITGILLASDYIQLGSGTTQRLYKVVEDADSDTGGNCTLEIFPELRESPANNDPITTSNCNRN